MESPIVRNILPLFAHESLEREEIMSTLPPSGDLRFSSPVTRAPHAVGGHCDIRQFRHTDFGSAMSPLVLVDHYVMTGPTFELHPHAGMSAVTLLFEDTQGWMSSHDSVHNHHRIEPGDLHWTLAGKGILHTQQPEGDHARLDGLQLFVTLPRRLKRIEPATMLLRARDVPVIESPGIRLRVLAGALEGKTSPLRTPKTDPDRRRLPGRRHSHRAAAAVRLESGGSTPGSVI